MKGKELERLVRADAMLRMRIANYSYEEIGKRFGITKQRVQQILKEYIDAMAINNIAEWKRQLAETQVAMTRLVEQYDDPKALRDQEAKVLKRYKHGRDRYQRRRSQRMAF